MSNDRMKGTVRPSEMESNPLVSDVVEKNICALIEAKQKEESAKSLQEHLADKITTFSGSMSFVFLHVVWFLAWVAINVGWLRVKPFDPYPFGLLTMIVSLEAIFLSTFVLLSQNRMQAAADKRADLDLQINLLAEHEITRLVKLVDAIADHLGVEEGQDPEVDELKKDVEPELVLEELERRAGKDPKR